MRFFFALTLGLPFLSGRVFAAVVRGPQSAGVSVAPAAVPPLELRPIDGAVGIGQSSSMLGPESIALEPIAPYQDSIRQAVLDIGALAVQPEGAISAEDRAVAQQVYEHLLGKLDVPEPKVGVFEGRFRGAEDYNVGFVDEERRTGISREVLESLKGYRKDLAEYLFHLGRLELDPPASKFDRQELYREGGLQRRLFGAENALGPRLREIIDSRAPEEDDLGMRKGHIGDRRILRDALLQAFVRTATNEQYALKAANTLARLQDGSLGKLGGWGVLDGAQVQSLMDGDGSQVDGIARKITDLIADYGGHGYTGPQIMKLLNRMAPVSLLLQIQRDTLISAVNLCLIVKGHADFDSWIYLGQTLAARIAARVHGASNALSIITAQGIDAALEWVNLAEPVAARIQERVGGPRNAWAIVIGQGFENAEGVVGRAEPAVLKLRTNGTRYSLAMAWEKAIMQGLAKYTR